MTHKAARARRAGATRPGCARCTAARPARADWPGPLALLATPSKPGFLAPARRPRRAPQVPGAAGDNLRAWLASADSKQLLNELEAVGLRCMSAPAGAAAAPAAPFEANGAAPAAPTGVAGGNGVMAAAGGGAGTPQAPEAVLSGKNVVVTGERASCNCV